jgi:hypothetical protein
MKRKKPLTCESRRPGAFCRRFLSEPAAGGAYVAPHEKPRHGNRERPQEFSDRTYGSQQVAANHANFTSTTDGAANTCRHSFLSALLPRGSGDSSRPHSVIKLGALSLRLFKSVAAWLIRVVLIAVIATAHMALVVFLYPERTLDFPAFALPTAMALCLYMMTLPQPRRMSRRTGWTAMGLLLTGLVLTLLSYWGGIVVALFGYRI